MGGLTGALLNSANAIDVFSRTFQTIENNITNANTPGYAKQDQLLLSLPFDPSQRLSGGVMLGPLINSRSEYLEQAVRTQQQALGNASQRSADLGQVEPMFDLTAKSGVADALNGLFASFSQLTVSPNDTVSRQGVLNAANRLAHTFQSTATGIAQVSSNVAIQTNDIVAQINTLAAQIARINSQYQASGAAQNDAGLDAQMHNALENLSQLTDFSVMKGSGGALTISIGGQAPLVIGDRQYDLTADLSSPQTAIIDGNGNDITAEITRGKLGALIQEKNTNLPNYLDDLNTLASSIADAVNGQLSQGLDQNGGPPSTPLFSYDPNGAAGTLSLNALTPDRIAAALGSAGGNGNAIALTQLANQPLVNGYTFTQFYGNLGSRIGTDVAAAQQDQQQAQDQLTQAQSQRSAASGVSLNEEATRMLQFQQAYQAAGKVISILNTLTQTTIDMIR